MRAAIVAIAIAVAEPAGTPVAFRTVAHGDDSRIDVRREVVARTPGVWQLIWFKHRGTTDAPDVDMRKEMVIAVFSGRQPTAGCALDIVSVSHEAGDIVVRYRILPAAAVDDDGGSQSSPFHVIAVPVETTKVRFVELRELLRTR